MTAGIDEPDRRGRTHLDRAGLDLTGNDGVRLRAVELLSSDWYVLRRTTFDLRHRDGHGSTEQRETYDRGNGATVLRYDVPLTAVRREAEEETGHRVGELTHLFDVFMSPGSVTEQLHCYAGPYDAGTRAHEGGGLADEGEDIEVVELDVDEALAAIGTRIVDAKTILLLQWAALSGPFSR